MTTDNQGVSREELLTACHRADWGQVIANGGPPCFHMMKEGCLCLRAEKWLGHPIDHHFVSLQTMAARLLDSSEKDKAEAVAAERERCLRHAKAHEDHGEFTCGGGRYGCAEEGDNYLDSSSGECDDDGDGGGADDDPPAHRGGVC